MSLSSTTQPKAHQPPNQRVKHQEPSIAILGAGAWGTALALHLSKQGHLVYLWSIDPNEITALRHDRMNHRYLPGYPFSELIQPTCELSTALATSIDVIIAIPSVGFRPLFTQLPHSLRPDAHLICGTKGIEAASKQFLHDVMLTACPRHAIALLSGPSFAKEVAAGLPTALTLATKQPDAFNPFIHAASTPQFRIQLSDDLIGVAISNLIKNIIAIAAGIIEGQALGMNARSALMTQGLAEMIQLGTALGGKLTTFIGLAGIGDLILTCTDNQSRNKRFGYALGQGDTPAEAMQKIGHIIEGKENAHTIIALAKQYQVTLTICETTCQVLAGTLSAKIAIEHYFKAIAPSIIS